MNVIKAVIFDLDGTLIDSNWVHLQSWRGALKILGVEFRDQEVIDRLGLRTVDIARQLLSNHGEQTIGRLVELKGQLFENTWRLEVKPRYGALGMLRIMKARGVRSAVASSNSTDRILKIVKYFGMDALLDAIVGTNEVEQGKPDPALVNDRNQEARSSPEGKHLRWRQQVRCRSGSNSRRTNRSCVTTGCGTVRAQG